MLNQWFSHQRWRSVFRREASTTRQGPLMWSLLESGAENGFNYQAVTIHLWQNIVLKSITMYRLYRKYIRLLFIIVFTIIISMTLCVITILRGNCTCELYVHVFICIYIYACTYHAYIQSFHITMYVYMTYVCTSYYIERYVASFNK